MADNQKDNNGGSSLWMDVSQNESKDNVNDLDTLSNEDNLSPVTPYSTTPAQIDRHLEFLDISDGGKLLMGSSSLVGRYWSGSIWYYDSPLLAPVIENCKSGLEFSSGVTEGVFLGENSAAIGMDGGILEFVTIGTNGSYLSKATTHDEYISAVTQVKLCCDSVSIVTGTTDSCIKVYDSSTATVSLTYNPAHAFLLTSISTHPSHPHLFLSSSLDGTVLLWDMRKNLKPACCIYESEDHPTAISWVNNNLNELFVGSSSGTINLRDVRKNKESIHSLSVFRRPIFRFKPNKFRENCIACCADDTKVAVLGVDDGNIIVRFESDSHSAFVRGLAWMKETCLLSCGWDKEVHNYFIK